MTQYLFYKQTLLTDKFKPKSADEFNKVKMLEKCLVKYVFLRLLEEISDSDFKKIRNLEMKHPLSLINKIKGKVPDFDQSFKKYYDEFLKKYVGSN